MSKPVNLRTHKQQYDNGVNPARRSGMLIPGGRRGYLLEGRRERAKVRQAARADRYVEQQIEALDRRLGPGVGAVKERARLARLLAVQ